MNVAALIGPAIGAGLQIYAGNKMAGSIQNASAAAAAAPGQAHAAYKRQVMKGLRALDDKTQSAKGYLSPYADMGEDYSGLIGDIIGLNGETGQESAWNMYRSNPSARLADRAREEAIRSTFGRFAAQGMSRANGALADELSRRTADIDFPMYQNWQDLIRGQQGIGVGAAENLANIDLGHGNALLNARTGIGTSRANAIVGRANTLLSGQMGAAGAKAYGMGGAASALSNMGGYLGGMGGGGGSGGGSYTTASMAGEQLPWASQPYSNVSSGFGGHTQRLGF